MIEASLNCNTYSSSAPLVNFLNLNNFNDVLCPQLGGLLSSRLISHPGEIVVLSIGGIW